MAGFGAVRLVLAAIDQAMGGFGFAIASAVAFILLRTVVGLDLGGPGHFLIDDGRFDGLGNGPVGYFFCFGALL